MHVLVVYAHPSESSFVGALHGEIRDVLRANGHEVDDLDLYAERFDPVLSPATYRNYLDRETNRAEVRGYVARLLAAEALAFVFPVWHDGPPAILKGFVDRVFLRGVVFEIDAEGVFRPLLGKIRRLAAVATYGADRVRTAHVGDLPRRWIERNLGALVAPDATVQYLADYGMDQATPIQRERFMKRVSRAFGGW